MVHDHIVVSHIAAHMATLTNSRFLDKMPHNAALKTTDYEQRMSNHRLAHGTTRNGH